MHAKIHTIAFRGIETIAVTVQIHIANGLPAMAIVGLADKAVAESRERVRAPEALNQFCCFCWGCPLRAVIRTRSI